MPSDKSVHVDFKVNKPEHFPTVRNMRLNLEDEETSPAVYITFKCSCGDEKCEFSVGATLDRYYDNEEVT